MCVCTMYTYIYICKSIYTFISIFALVSQSTDVHTDMDARGCEYSWYTWTMAEIRMNVYIRCQRMYTFIRISAIVHVYHKYSQPRASMSIYVYRGYSQPRAPMSICDKMHIHNTHVYVHMPMYIHVHMCVRHYLWVRLILVTTNARVCMRQYVYTQY